MASNETECIDIILAKDVVSKSNRPSREFEDNNKISLTFTAGKLGGSLNCNI